MWVFTFMKWFKFYGQDWLTDLKVRELSIEDRLCYLTLLCLAASADEGGLVRGVTEWSIISLTNLPFDYIHDYNPVEEASGCLKRFADLGMILIEPPVDGNALPGVTYDVTVRNFSKRQEQNMSNAEKQKKYRERQKRLQIRTDSGKNDGNVTVTQSNVRYPRIDKNRIDNTEKSKDSSFFKETPHAVSGITTILEEVEDITRTPIDEEGNEIQPKKKVKSNPVAKEVWGQWLIMCKKEMGKTPFGGAKDFVAINSALSKLGSKEKVLDCLDEWLGLGKPDEEAIHITRALSNYQLNGYLSRNQ